MPRPAKATVDYFPHFVQHKKTMFTLDAKFGNDGYAFWFKLLEILGDTENHYININESETWEFLLAKTNLTDVLANEILNLLIRLKAIDRDLFAHGIIYSQNFIDNLETVYSRRGINVINKDTLIRLMLTETPLNGVFVDINPQRRVEESKGENSIVKERKINETLLKKNNPEILDCTDQINFDFDFVWDIYQKKRGDKIKLSKKWEKLTDLERERAVEHIKLYVAAEPDKQFRKDLDNYLNNKCWNDEIIAKSNPKSNNSVNQKFAAANSIIDAMFDGKKHN